MKLQILSELGSMQQLDYWFGENFYSFSHYFFSQQEIYIWLLWNMGSWIT